MRAPEYILRSPIAKVSVELCSTWGFHNHLPHRTYAFYDSSPPILLGTWVKTEPRVRAARRHPANKANAEWQTKLSDGNREKTIAGQMGRAKSKADHRVLQRALPQDQGVSGQCPAQVTSLSSGLEHNSLHWWSGSRARQQLEKERCPGEQNRLEVLHCGSQPWLNIRITWGTVKTSDFSGSHPRLTKTYSKHILATKESLLATQEAFINFL